MPTRIHPRDLGSAVDASTAAVVAAAAGSQQEQQGGAKQAEKGVKGVLFFRGVAVLFRRRLPFLADVFSSSSLYRR